MRLSASASASLGPLLALMRVYDAWGSPRFTTGTATSRLGYTGEIQSGALVYLQARWYHAGLSTFTSRDTFAGVPSAKPPA